MREDVDQSDRELDKLAQDEDDVAAGGRRERPRTQQEERRG